MTTHKTKEAVTKPFSVLRSTKAINWWVSLESNVDSKSWASSQTFDKTSKRTISSSHSKPWNSEKYSTLQWSKLTKNSKDKIPQKKQLSSGKLE